MQSLNFPIPLIFKNIFIHLIYLSLQCKYLEILCRNITKSQFSLILHIIPFLHSLQKNSLIETNRIHRIKDFVLVLTIFYNIFPDSNGFLCFVILFICHKFQPKELIWLVVSRKSEPGSSLHSNKLSRFIYLIQCKPNWENNCQCCLLIKLLTRKKVSPQSYGLLVVRLSNANPFHSKNFILHISQIQPTLNLKQDP